MVKPVVSGRSSGQGKRPRVSWETHKRLLSTSRQQVYRHVTVGMIYSTAIFSVESMNYVCRQYVNVILVAHAHKYCGTLDIGSRPRACTFLIVRGWKTLNGSVTQKLDRGKKWTPQSNFRMRKLDRPCEKWAGHVFATIQQLCRAFQLLSRQHNGWQWWCIRQWSASILMVLSYGIKTPTSEQCSTTRKKKAKKLVVRDGV